MTVRYLITGSLRLLGVVGEGETPSSQAMTDALSALNDLVDSYSNNSLLIYSKIRESFTLTAGQQTYTFGTGGNFNSARPQLIENALIVPPQSNPVEELPMKICNKDEYAAIRLKTIQSSIPLYLYNDDAYPITNINVWPVPSATTSMVLYSWKALSEFTSIDQTVSLPPGYSRMLRYNLAIELAPEYGKEATQTVLGIAIQSKASVKRMNIKPLYLSIDPALQISPNRFNWRTGDAT